MDIYKDLYDQARSLVLICRKLNQPIITDTSWLLYAITKYFMKSAGLESPYNYSLSGLKRKIPKTLQKINAPTLEYIEYTRDIYQVISIVDQIQKATKRFHTPIIIINLITESVINGNTLYQLSRSRSIKQIVNKLDKKSYILSEIAQNLMDKTDIESIIEDEYSDIFNDVFQIDIKILQNAIKNTELFDPDFYWFHLVAIASNYMNLSQEDV